MKIWTQIYLNQKIYTSEYTNIFVSKNLTRTNAQIFVLKIVRIFEYLSRMSEYIRTNKFDTKECPSIFVKEKLIQTNVRIYIRDQYARIFEYNRHALVQNKEMASR